MTTKSSTNDDLFNLDLIRSYVDKEQNPRFVERRWLKKQVEEKLAETDCRFVLLTAEPGAGKSSFMAWLAHQHSDWCRYFIRRDQRTPLGDAGSYSFLLQVGFQLAATYPDLFKKEQIRIVVEQRIGTATNSEIVGAEIGKMFASPFYQKIIQIQQQVTHSKDTNITGVRVGEFYATERDLPLDNLQFMALFDPAKAMMKKIQEATEHPNQQIVVLVDALDELRYQDSELSLLKWLTNCPELPSNLRFVLTSRPDDDLLRAFRGNQKGRIQEIEIADEDPDVEKDLTQYTRFLIETTEVNQALIEIHHDVDKFTDRAVKKANGNFGYLGAIGRAVDEAIRQNEEQLLREILKLSELPDTLQDLYAFFLSKIKDAVAKEKVPVEDAEGEIGFMPVWSAVYKPILGILSVALEPLTPTQIQKLGLIQAEFDYVTGAIERLQQFLDQLGNCYRLYHSTLPEFFTSPKTKERSDYSYCYVDAIEQNQRVVKYYQAGAKSWAETNLKKIAEDDYGRRYLAQHLVKSDHVEELHALLRLEKDGKNAWFKVKDDEGETAGFLADVELAWAKAEEAYADDATNLALQCQYALMTTSIKSLARNLSKNLLILLVKKKIWTEKKAFSYIMQFQNLNQQIDVLLDLVLIFKDDSLQKKAWRFILDGKQLLLVTEDVRQHFIKIITNIPIGYIQDVYELILQIPSTSVTINDGNARKLEAILQIFPRLLNSLKEDSLKIAIKILLDDPQVNNRVFFIVDILPYLSRDNIIEMFRLFIINEYPLNNSFQSVFLAFSVYLPEEYKIKLWKRLMEYGSGTNYLFSLINDKFYELGFVQVALSCLEVKIAAYLPPNTFEEALELVAAASEYKQPFGLFALVFYMPQSLRQKALTIATSIKSNQSKVCALRLLLPYMDGNQNIVWQEIINIATIQMCDNTISGRKATNLRRDSSLQSEHL